MDIDIISIANYVKDNWGGTLISRNVIVDNGSYKLKFRCQNNHYNTIYVNDIYKGNFCPDCICDKEVDKINQIMDQIINIGLSIFKIYKDLTE